MTWHLKDREVEKALIKLCPWFLDRLNWGVSSKEMGKEYVYVSFERTMNNWVLDDCELMFWMEELEDIPEYRTDKWNEYPKVTPPYNVMMRIELHNGLGFAGFYKHFLEGDLWCYADGVAMPKGYNDIVKRFRPWEN